ncbi:unnamed protein product [Gongylonema pulchrum]|uniref:NUC153 domain-containing protein n=1 Tax=Gongylonema pulchrum TaxID=637853 RepID=A0A183EJY0_9BILA|nr:unnamed protein product [Gongylonema pulchrum]
MWMRQGGGIVTFAAPSSSAAEQRPAKKAPKKILKSALKNSDEKVISLKKVTFDVEKFAADECDDIEERDEARARLAIKLGAQPPKSRFVNYKQLKEELSTRKLAQPEFDKLSALKAMKKLSMKNRAKTKKIRRH